MTSEPSRQLVHVFRGIIREGGGPAAVSGAAVSVSPGPLRAGRLRCVEDHVSAYANGNDLFLLQHALPVASELLDVRPGVQGSRISEIMPLGGVSSVSVHGGADGASSWHGAEVQAVDVCSLPDGGGRHWLLSSDERGCAKAVLADLSVPVRDEQVPGKRRRATALEAPASASASASASACSSTLVDDEEDDGDAVMCVADAAVAEAPLRSLPEEHKCALVEIQPPSGCIFDVGWSAVAADPLRTSGASLGAVIASHFGQYVSVYDGERLSRTMYTSHCPAALMCAQLPEASGTASLLLVAENNVMSVWDPRVAAKSGCVERVRTGAGAVHDFDVHPAGKFVAVAGEDKNVGVYDSRKWKSQSQWSRATKFQLLSVNFSHAQPDLIFVAGLDHELTCGRWDGSAVSNTRFGNPSRFQRQGIRGDSRWIGLDLMHESDTIVGTTDTAALYVLRHPANMLLDGDED